MVGIVIVSHSEKIAEGVKEVAEQMVPEVKIYSAGGTDDGRIGTDAMKISAAIENAFDKDGVMYSCIIFSRSIILYILSL